MMTVDLNPEYHRKISVRPPLKFRIVSQSSITRINFIYVLTSDIRLKNLRIDTVIKNKESRCQTKTVYTSTSLLFTHESLIYLSIYHCNSTKEIILMDNIPSFTFISTELQQL